MTQGTDTRGAVPARLRVVIVDRRPLIAEGLARIVGAGAGLEVVTVTSGEPSTVATTIAAGRPDLVLIGVAVEPRAALALVSTLALRIGGAPIVLIADALRHELVTCVLERSLGGLLLTDHPADDLVASLRQIAHGRAVLPVGWQRELAPTPGPIDALSQRQLEVLRLLAEGCSYDEIAVRLSISVNTVKFHMRSIFERLGVRNRMAAVRILSDAAAADLGP